VRRCRFGVALATASLAGAGTAATAAGADPAAYFNPADFSSEALFVTGLTTAGARATGLAGATTAIADDAFAVVQNPAGLAQLVKIEIVMGLRNEPRDATFEMFDAQAALSERSSGVDAVAVAYPLPTYRGSLVLGAGIFRSRTNARASARRDTRTAAVPPESAFRFDDEFVRRQGGEVWQFAAGLGTDVRRDLSLGLSASYWYAALRDDQFRHIDEQFAGAPPPSEDRLRSESTLGGVSCDAGLLAYPSRSTRIGFVVRSPVWAWLDGSGTLTHTDLTSGATRTGALFIEQRPRLPWSAALGGSYARGAWLVAAETRYVAWEELDMDAPPAPGASPAADPDYTARFAAHAGLEWALPRVPVRVRTGFAYEPLAYDLLLGREARRVHDRRTWSGGAGMLLSPAFALDVALAVTTAERADRDEPAVRECLNDRRFLLSGSYRY